MRVGSSRIRDEDSQFDAVGEKTEPLTGGEKNTPCDLQPAVSVSSAAPCWRVEVFLEIGGPDAELRRSVFGFQYETAIFVALTSVHRWRGVYRGVPERLNQWVDDVMADSEGAPTDLQRAEFAAVRLPRLK
jgi:hypothetical protein